MVAAAPAPVPPSRWRLLARTLQTLWSIIGIALVLLFVLDAALGAYLKHRERDQFRAYMSTYPAADRSWVPIYTEEFLLHDKALWRPYVYWRRAPFVGQYFGVEERGLRHTWNRPHAPAEKPLRIFTFGGSTMWGTGVRPDYTVASCLARSLEEQGIAVEVTNYGEGGYVSTQELLTLLFELRRGKVPDLVIFLDGFNDVSTSFQNAKAGLTSNEMHRVEEFNADERRSRLQKALALIPGVRRFAAGLGNRLVKPYSVSTEQAPALAADTIRVYRENIRVAELFGREYGFQSLFYWQPIIYQKDELAPNEVQAARDLSYMKDFLLRVYQEQKNDAQLAARPAFHNVSEIFRHTAEGVFADFAHLTEHGNDLLARRMAEDVAPLVRAQHGKPPASATETPRR